jgi:hypothetical protein
MLKVNQTSSSGAPATCHQGQCGERLENHVEKVCASKKESKHLYTSFPNNTLVA